jgi:CheY-like chemotaxis protein
MAPLADQAFRRSDHLVFESGSTQRYESGTRDPRAHLVGRTATAGQVSLRRRSWLHDFLESDPPEGPTVLDVRLPGQSGLDFQHELAAANKEIPIIFITTRRHPDVGTSDEGWGQLNSLRSRSAIKTSSAPCSLASLAIVRGVRMRMPWLPSESASGR